MTTIRLTTRQAQALADRLTLPDCIHDATGLPGGPELDQRCRRLEALVLTGRINLDQLDDTDRRVLVDAHDGSTWWAQQESEARTNLDVCRASRTVWTLREKLAAAGLPVGDPVDW